MTNYYALKSHNCNDYMSIEKELEDGFVIRIVRDIEAPMAAAVSA